jgi:hypothetical protein
MPMAGKKKKPNHKKPRRAGVHKPKLKKPSKTRGKFDDDNNGRLISPFDQDRRRRSPLMGKPQSVNDDDEDQGALGAFFEDLQELDAEHPGNDAISEAQKKRDDWTRAKLKEIFNAEKWIDRTAEMKEKWKQIAPEEKKLFDFAQAYSEACRITLKRHMKPDGFDF